MPRSPTVGRGLHCNAAGSIGGSSLPQLHLVSIRVGCSSNMSTPTPTYGPGGSFTISCASRIAATPRECLDVVVRASECTK